MLISNNSYRLPIYPLEFANELNPYVRDKYLELWHGIQDSPVGPVEPWPD